MRTSTNTSIEKATKKCQHLHKSQARHVWPPTSMIIGQQTPQKMSKQTRLPTKQISTWPLETRHKTTTVHTGCQ
jgi:hypothetical protein